MNLLSTAITEVDTGELLILWGGRRIVTTCLIPPLILFPPSALLEDVIERIMVRRYRWDSGPLILTRIYDDYKKREDYLAIAFGRNPAILKDFYGRLILAYRIPIISSQDPMGALSTSYVIPQNIGTTAGMNFWDVFNSYDFAGFRTDMNFDWQEQTDIKIGAMQVLFGQDYENIGTLLENITDKEPSTELEDGYLLFTDITQHNITGDIFIRGMGGNLIDEKNIKRWRWNEDEGLGRSYTSCIIDKSGRQVRLAGNQLVASKTDRWDNDNISAIHQTEGSYGQSGCLREDTYGHYVVAGYNNNKSLSIPFVIENENGIQTEEFGKEKVKVDDKEITIDEKYEDIWADYNEKKAVIEGADIPHEQHFSYETPPTPEQEEEARRLLAYSYYQLPTINEQRVGLCVSKITGQIFLSWMSGNLTFIEKEKGQFIAVGLRTAVSNDNGKTFQPLCPERINYFRGEI